MEWEKTMPFSSIKIMRYKLSTKNIFVRLVVYALCILFCLGLFLWLCLHFSPYPYKDTTLLSDTSFSRQVLDKNNNLLRLTLSEDEKYRLYGTLEEVNANTQKALLLYEDKHFYRHFGVNPFSLVRAFYTSFIKKDRIVGASTISMQTARLLFGLKTTTIKGKLKQIWYALLLEYHHTKHEILQAYFNLAPYGGNIEGIFAASRIYFHKTASNLTLDEVLALVPIPQNPSKRNPFAKDFEKIRSLFYDKWLEHFPEYIMNNQALSVYSIKDIPFLAPHFTQNVLEQSEKNTMTTSLESHIQKQVEQSISAFVHRHGLYGIHNAAALLVHAPSMEIKAYVGSANYYNESIDGQVDALIARRSPGSTLKPFIYALAMEQGLIHEGTVLLDIPLSFSGYNPENYNAEYSGPLSAQKALILSRNIPAVNLASKLENPNLYEFLIQAKVELLQSEEHYGLSLVLGGAEVEALELARLYAMLINQGLEEDLIFEIEPEQEQKQEQVYSLLSKEVAAITLHMLEHDQYYLQTRKGTIPLRLKTGTSNGFKDAWTVGQVGEYVLLVWIGNFDNTSNVHFTGRELAVPLFTEIAHALTRLITFSDPLAQQIENMDIRKIEICTDTGDIDTSLCKDKAKSSIYFIPGLSPQRATGILRPLLIDKRTNERVCRKTLENQAFIEEEIGEFWSSEAQYYFQQAGIYKNSPPPFKFEDLADPLCNQKIDDKGQSPNIISPKEGITYYINKDNKNIALKASANFDSAWLYWFVNEKYIGKALANDILFYTPTSEILDISVVDVYGRTSKKKYAVKFQ